MVFIAANEYFPWRGSESLWSATAERSRVAACRCTLASGVGANGSSRSNPFGRWAARLFTAVRRRWWIASAANSFRDVNLLGSMSGHLEPVQEYFRAVYERYHQAGREAKHFMLNE